MSKQKTWLDCGRDDLHGIPFMLSHGYITNFSYKDRMYNRTEPNCIPHDAVGFIKDNIYCWKAFVWNTMYRDDVAAVYNWQTARLVNGYFVEHLRFDTLEEIVEHYL